MKTACIYHSVDQDGWMSAAIVKHWFIKQQTNDYLYTIRDVNSGATLHKGGTLETVLNFIGYNYGQPIPDLSEYDQVIMVDISFPKEVMTDIMVCFKENFIWIDHHISAIKANLDSYGNSINGLQDTNFAACELTWQYFFPNEPMPEIVRLLGRYDCFGHKGTSEEQKVLEFQYGARRYISSYNDAYTYLDVCINDKENITLNRILNDGASIYQYLCSEAKSAYKNGFAVKFIEKVDMNTTWRYDFICINKERFNPINFCIDYHKEGYDGAACFHYDGDTKKWCFSLYNDNGEVDCSIIAKQYGGGGHRGAAGFTVDNINEIIK